MSEKNVDGVKKLSKEELDKSRKIVLDAISDRRVAKKADVPKANAAHKTVDAIKEPFKKQVSVASELAVELSEDKKKKAHEELDKIIPPALPAGRGQKEKTLEKKIVSRPKEEAKLIPKEPIIKLSDEKKKKWREELNRELGKKNEKKSEPVDRAPACRQAGKPVNQPEPEPAQKRESKKIATDFLHSSQEKPKAEKIFDIRAKQKHEIAPAIKEKREKIISRINPFNNELIADRINKREVKKQPKPKVAPIFKKEKAKLIKAEKKRKQKEKKKKEEALKFAAEQSRRLLRQKKKEEKKRKEVTRNIQKAAARRQRGIARKEYKEKIIKVRIRLHQSVNVIFKELLNAYKRVLVLGLFGLAAALLLYASLLIVIIEYSIDNKVTRHIARLIPIPAYVSKEGTVNYYTYRDIRAQLELSGLNSEELTKATKIAVVEKIIIDNLARRYGLMPESISNGQGDIRALLNERIVFDQDINQVGVKRIRKIKELIDQSGDFVKVANKYGDDQGQITLSAFDKAEYEYYEKVSRLDVGDVSQIITTSDGYYLFRCFDKKNDKLYLSFVHVRAKTLSEYIEESIMDYKLWSLVD